MNLTPEEFDELVQKAIAEVPEFAKEFLEEVVVDVEAMPSRADCARLGIRNPRSLLGLYHGVPRTKRGLGHAQMRPDHITIYKDNIERISRTRDQIIEQVRKTVLHEIGHHFGLDEEDLREVGY
jgi:predicted Zn-dependent protease with MMP-like domain